MLPTTAYLATSTTFMKINALEIVLSTFIIMILCMSVALALSLESIVRTVTIRLSVLLAIQLMSSSMGNVSIIRPLGMPMFQG